MSTSLQRYLKKVESQKQKSNQQQQQQQLSPIQNGRPRMKLHREWGKNNTLSHTVEQPQRGWQRNATGSFTIGGGGIGNRVGSGAQNRSTLIVGSKSSDDGTTVKQTSSSSLQTVLRQSDKPKEKPTLKTTTTTTKVDTAMAEVVEKKTPPTEKDDPTPQNDVTAPSVPNDIKPTKTPPHEPSQSNDPPQDETPSISTPSIEHETEQQPARENVAKISSPRTTTSDDDTTTTTPKSPKSPSLQKIEEHVRKLEEVKASFLERENQYKHDLSTQQQHEVAMQRQLQTLRQELRTTKEKLLKEEQRARALETELEEATEEISKVKMDAAKRDKEMKELRDTIAKQNEIHETQINAKDECIQHQTEEIATLQNELHSVQTSLHQATESHETTTKLLTAMEESKQQIILEYETKCTELQSKLSKAEISHQEQLQQHQNSHATSLAQERQQLQKARDDVAVAEYDLQLRQNEIRELRSRLNGTLEERSGGEAKPLSSLQKAVRMAKTPPQGMSLGSGTFVPSGGYVQQSFGSSPPTQNGYGQDYPPTEASYELQQPMTSLQKATLWAKQQQEGQHVDNRIDTVVPSEDTIVRQLNFNAEGFVPREREPISATPKSTLNAVSTSFQPGQYNTVPLDVASSNHSSSTDPQSSFIPQYQAPSTILPPPLPDETQQNDDIHHIEPSKSNHSPESSNEPKPMSSLQKAIQQARDRRASSDVGNNNNSISIEPNKPKQQQQHRSDDTSSINTKPKPASSLQRAIQQARDQRRASNSSTVTAESEDKSHGTKHDGRNVVREGSYRKKIHPSSLRTSLEIGQNGRKSPANTTGTSYTRNRNNTTTRNGANASGRGRGGRGRGRNNYRNARNTNGIRYSASEKEQAPLTSLQKAAQRAR